MTRHGLIVEELLNNKAAARRVLVAMQEGAEARDHAKYTAGY